MEQAGYSVWIDLDEMQVGRLCLTAVLRHRYHRLFQGSILEAMSYAIEGAGLVIFIMSEQYKESNACRTEVRLPATLQAPCAPLTIPL